MKPGRRISIHPEPEHPGQLPKPRPGRMMRRPASTKLRQAHAKPAPVRSGDYRLWLRTHECAVPGCDVRGESRIEAAHTGPHGLSTKADDIRCLPLCAAHHRAPGQGLDAIGRLEFERRYQMDINRLALKFIADYIAEGGTF